MSLLTGFDKFNCKLAHQLDTKFRVFLAYLICIVSKKKVTQGDSSLLITKTLGKLIMELKTKNNFNKRIPHENLSFL